MRKLEQKVLFFGFNSEDWIKQMNAVTLEEGIT